MTNDPMFTVIIPVYNSEAYISDCLNSVFSQTFGNYELLIVDDGSSDHSVEIINQMIEGRPNCRLIQNAHGGVCQARNTALEQASGQYICFVDSDDLIFLDYLETLNSEIEQYAPDILYFEVKYGVNNRPRKQGADGFSIDSVDIFLLSYAALYHTPEIDSQEGHFSGINSFSTCGQVYKRELYQISGARFTEGITRSEDGLLNLELLHYAKCGRVIHKQLYIYRTDNASATRSYKPDLLEVFQLRDEKVKQIIRNLYSDDPDHHLHAYYCSLIFEMRVVLEMTILHPNNQAPNSEKKALFERMLQIPDYSYALDHCGSEYLTGEDRTAFDVLKMRSYSAAVSYIKQKERKKYVHSKLRNAYRMIKGNSK